MARPYRILFTKSDTTPEKTLLTRVGIVLGLVSVVVAVLWWDREGLRDHLDGEIAFWDVVYFTMVTITTVGYGDIVPVTERARLIDSMFVTPVRVFIWFIFLGTAYQFVFQKFVEGYRMSKLQQRLDQHIIICGYGDTGRIAANELKAKGHSPDQIVVVELSAQTVQEAAEDGFVALRGDAARGSVIQKAGIQNAQAVIVSPGRDDTNVLIVLTIRQFNKIVKIISSAKQEENIKLLKQAGADVIVSPSMVGGYMLAGAVDRFYTVDYLYDLMTAGGRVRLVERPALPEEVGKAPTIVGDGFVVRLHRGKEKLGIQELRQTTIRMGDVLLIVSPAEAKVEK